MYGCRLLDATVVWLEEDMCTVTTTKLILDECHLSDDWVQQLDFQYKHGDTNTYLKYGCASLDPLYIGISRKFTIENV